MTSVTTMFSETRSAEESEKSGQVDGMGWGRKYELWSAEIHEYGGGGTVHHTCHRLVVVALYLSSTGAADGLRKSDNALPPDSHINQ